MKNIEELTGRELDAAVAEALGWEWRCPVTAQCQALYSPDDIEHYPARYKPANNAERCYDWDVNLPHYSTDIALAIDILGGEWDWDYGRYENELHVWVYLPEYEKYSTLVLLSDFISKATAFATAHCRTWLKAKQ